MKLKSAVVGIGIAFGVCGIAHAFSLNPFAPSLEDNAQLDAKLATQNVALAQTIRQIDCAPSPAPAGTTMYGFECEVEVIGQQGSIKFKKYADDPAADSWLSIGNSSIAGLKFRASNDTNGKLQVRVNIETPRIANVDDAVTTIKVMLDQAAKSPAVNSDAAQSAAKATAEKQAWDAKAARNQASWGK